MIPTQLYIVLWLYFVRSCDLLVLATFIHIDVTLLSPLHYDVVFYLRLRYLHCVCSFEISNNFIVMYTMYIQWHS